MYRPIVCQLSGGERVNVSVNYPYYLDVTIQYFNVDLILITSLSCQIHVGALIIIL